MGVKELLNSSKYNKDSITARIDNYLATNVEENDRAVDVNSPSQVFKCMRSLYYARTGAESDGFIDPRYNVFLTMEHTCIYVHKSI